jgi:hypothetical protein
MRPVHSAGRRRPVHSAGGVHVHSTGRQYAHTAACTMLIITRALPRKQPHINTAWTTDIMAPGDCSSVLALDTSIMYSLRFAPGPTCRGSALSAFRPRGVPRPTSKLSLRAPAQMGRRETEHKEGENRGFVLSCAQGGCACSRGLQASARERERERAYPSAHPPTRPPPRTRALDLPFIDVRRRPRCIMGGVAIC